jgi:hypothetical protein
MNDFDGDCIKRVHEWVQKMKFIEDNEDLLNRIMDWIEVHYPDGAYP